MKTWHSQINQAICLQEVKLRFEIPTGIVDESVLENKWLALTTTDTQKTNIKLYFAMQVNLNNLPVLGQIITLISMSSDHDNIIQQLDTALTKSNKEFQQEINLIANNLFSASAIQLQAIKHCVSESQKKICLEELPKHCDDDESKINQGNCQYLIAQFFIALQEMNAPNRASLFSEFLTLLSLDSAQFHQGLIKLMRDPGILFVSLKGACTEPSDKKKFDAYFLKHFNAQNDTQLKAMEIAKKQLANIIEHLRYTIRPDIIIKLQDEIELCVLGFYDRVEDATHHLIVANNLAELVALLCRSFIEEIFTELERDKPADLGRSVHSHHRIFYLANKAQLGVNGPTVPDIFSCSDDTEELTQLLIQGMQNRLLPENIIRTLWNNASPIIRYGYAGKLDRGYQIGPIHKIFAFFKKMFPHDELELTDCFEIDPDTSLTTDINWYSINSLLLKNLLRGHFFLPIENSIQQTFTHKNHKLTITHAVNDPLLHYAPITYEYVDQDENDDDDDKTHIDYCLASMPEQIAALMGKLPAELIEQIENYALNKAPNHQSAFAYYGLLPYSKDAHIKQLGRKFSEPLKKIDYLFLQMINRFSLEKYRQCLIDIKLPIKRILNNLPLTTNDIFPVENEKRQLLLTRVKSILSKNSDLNLATIVLLLNQLRPDEQYDLMIALQEKLFDAAKNITKFSFLINQLSPGAFSQLAAILKLRLISYFPNINYLRELNLKVSTEENGKRNFSTLVYSQREVIEKMLLSGNDYSFVLSNLPYTHQTAFIHSQQEKLLQFFTTLDALKAEACHLSPDNFSLTLQLLLQKNVVYIKSEDAFLALLKEIPLAHCTKVCIDNDKYIKPFLQNSMQFQKLLNAIGSAKIATIIKQYLEIIAQGITNIDEFNTVITHADKNEKKAIFTLVQDKLITSIKNINDIKVSLNTLDPVFITPLISSVSFSITFKEFISAMEECPERNKCEFLNGMLKKLPSLLTTYEDLDILFNTLDPDLLEIAYNEILPKIALIINTNIDHFAKILERIPAHLYVDFCKIANIDQSALLCDKKAFMTLVTNGSIKLIKLFLTAINLKTFLHLFPTANDFINLLMMQKKHDLRKKLFHNFLAKYITHIKDLPSFFYAMLNLNKEEGTSLLTHIQNSLHALITESNPLAELFRITDLNQQIIICNGLSQHLTGVILTSIDFNLILSTADIKLYAQLFQLLTPALQRMLSTPIKIAALFNGLSEEKSQHLYFLLCLNGYIHSAQHAETIFANCKQEQINSIFFNKSIPELSSSRPVTTEHLVNSFHECFTLLNNNTSWMPIFARTNYSEDLQEKHLSPDDEWNEIRLHAKQKPDSRTAQALQLLFIKEKMHPLTLADKLSTFHATYSLLRSTKKFQLTLFAKDQPLTVKKTSDFEEKIKKLAVTEPDSTNALAWKIITS